MSARSIIVGTAGHIDHGKTTLIRALTGVDTDRLKEEQQRGITIELGFAPLDIGDLHIGFVDVPGHEKFVKHMLAGAGGIDLMLLVVAADESVMPQTREHVEICRLLGIGHAVVAITKADLADSETIELVELETIDLLEENGFADAVVVPVSGATGLGMDELKAALSKAAEGVGARETDLLPRLPVDRVFTMRGHGTVITGTLISGELRTGGEVELVPSGKRSPVKSLQVHGQPVQTAVAGHRVAANVPGVAVDDIERGEALTVAGLLQSAAILDLHINVLSDSPCDLENNQRVRFHIGSAELLGRVEILDGRKIIPGGDWFVRIRLERPAAALVGDRFVIRRYSPMNTIGGGEVLDNSPEIRVDKTSVVKHLQEMQSLDRRGRARLYLGGSKQPVDAKVLAARFGYVRDAAVSLMNEALEAGEVVTLSTEPLVVIGKEYFETFCSTVADAIRRRHEAQPLADSFPTDSIRGELPKRTDETLFKATLTSLKESGVVRIEAGSVALAEHNVGLTDEQQKTYDAVESAFHDAGMSPPSPNDVISEQKSKEARNLFELLIARGRLIRIARDMFYHADVLEKLIADLRQKAGDSAFAVPEFKDWFGISRKFAIPLLEYLDARGITYRQGDERKLTK